MPFQNVLYKSRYTILHVDPPPQPSRFEPCAEMANRRQPSDRLRGRELPPGTAPGSDLHSHMYWLRWGFLVSVSSAGICALRAVSTGVPTKQRQAHEGSSANMHPWSSRSTGALVFKSLPEAATCHYESPLLERTFFLFHLKKYQGPFSVRLPVLQKKRPILYGKDSFGSPKTSDNRNIQICQLEKDTERTKFFFKSAVSTVRQTKSTVWIIHVRIGFGGPEGVHSVV